MSPEDRIKEEVDAIFKSIRDAQTAMAKDLAEVGLICGSLNPNLVARQRLTQDDINQVTALHKVKNQLFERMEKLDPVGQRQELQLCVLDLQEIEFGMQRAWKFEEDADRHSWWYRAPHCRCPRMDNSDPLMPNRITRQDCPLHGWDSE